MNCFKHYISLGFFCSVALELERIGLRGTSSPFDWQISAYDGVIKAIENHFEDFLKYEFLFQDSKIREHYLNTKYNIWFYHDFNKYESLQKQLPNVEEKYKRRIERFYKDIQEPTLFIRYISDAETQSINGKPEICWIEENHEYILTVLKSFNVNNDILYIANDEITSDSLQIYHVKKDPGDSVARKPLEKNLELYNLLNSVNHPSRERNIEKYQIKQKEKNNKLNLAKKKVASLSKRMLKREYIHNQCI